MFNEWLFIERLIPFVCQSYNGALLGHKLSRSCTSLLCIRHGALSYSGLRLLEKKRTTAMQIACHSNAANVCLTFYQRISMQSVYLSAYLSRYSRKFTALSSSRHCLLDSLQTFTNFVIHTLCDGIFKHKNAAAVSSAKWPFYFLPQVLRVRSWKFQSK